MTQTAPAYELISVNTELYPVAELPCTHQAVLGAELAEKLVIAQQVYDVDGTPFRIPEPGKWRDDIAPAEWDAYIAKLRALRENGAATPTIAMQPYLGTVRTLGENAAYFALQPDAYRSTAILPFGVVKPHGGIASRFRLFEVV